MITMKTSPHTDTVHVLDRSGTHALCRSNLTPHTWLTRGDSDEMVERSAIYRQSGDTFKRSCSNSRVNCLACRRKLDQEVMVAEGLAHDVDAVLTAMAQEPEKARRAATPAAVNMAHVMAAMGFLELTTVHVEGYGNTGAYRLTDSGRRAAEVVPAVVAEHSLNVVHVLRYADGLNRERPVQYARPLRTHIAQAAEVGLVNVVYGIGRTGRSREFVDVDGIWLTPEGRRVLENATMPTLDQALALLSPTQENALRNAWHRKGEWAVSMTRVTRAALSALGLVGAGETLTELGREAQQRLRRERFDRH